MISMEEYLTALRDLIDEHGGDLMCVDERGEPMAYPEVMDGACVMAEHR